MKAVAAFRPFAPEPGSPNADLGPFDWIQALKMSAASVERSCGAPHFALTDLDTRLPVQAYQFETTHRRLMLWILEVSLRYLESAAFDDDTVFMGADVLALQDLRFGFAADLGYIARAAKFPDPVLNSAQWWSVAAKPRLIAFYRAALAIAEELPDETIRWGADTVPVAQLLAPAVVGPSERAGLSAYGWPEEDTIVPLMSVDIWRLDLKIPTVLHDAPLLDFRSLRKQHMARYYKRTFGRLAS